MPLKKDIDLNVTIVYYENSFVVVLFVSVECLQFIITLDNFTA